MTVAKSYKILVINWQDIRHPMSGGAEVHLHEIFRRVAAAGHQVTLLCSHFKGAPAQETVDGINIVRRGNRDFFNYFVPGAYFELRHRHRFEIVLDDLNKIPFFTPLFVKEPILAIAHHFFGKSIFKEVSPLYAGYVYGSEYLVRYVYRRTPFAVVSESTRQELRRWNMRGDIHLLPNAVDLQRYKPSERAVNLPVIGYLGRIKKYKSVDHLIRALPLIQRQVPDAMLKIIGGGDALPELRKLAKAIGLGGQIIFTDFVSHEDKVRHLNECSVIVNPSPKEGWGLTVIEANACHKLVVAADSPGLRDSVVNGKTGVLYEYGNLPDLAAAVVDLLLNDDKRRQLQVNAGAWAEKWNWDASAKIAMDLIEKYVQY
jgi:glycosyltransferase involved in cell wall biosynthesis